MEKNIYPSAVQWNEKTAVLKVIFFFSPFGVHKQLIHLMSKDNLS